MVKDDETEMRIAQKIIVDKLNELNPEGLKGFRVIIYHESDTLDDILKIDSDAVKFDF